MRAATAATAATSPSVPLATTPDPGHEIVRVVWIFQAICAFPTLLVLGFFSFAQLFEGYIDIYLFMSVVTFS
jgi:hypothetical protein